MKADTIQPFLSLQNPSLPLEEEEKGLNLGQILGVLQRKSLLILGCTIVTVGIAGIKVLTATPDYIGQFEILVKSKSTETQVISNIEETLTTQTQNFKVDEDLLKILKSPSVLESTIKELRTRYPHLCPSPPSDTEIFYDLCYKDISKELVIEASGKDSKIVRVIYQDADPLKVQLVLDLVSKAYLDYSLESKRTDIRKGIEFVNSKLPDLQNKVDSLQDQLQALRIRNNLIDPASRGSQLSSQVTSFSNEQLELEVELQQTRQRYNDLRQQLLQSQEKATASALNDNPRYQSLLNELLELDSQIAETSILFLDSSPDMQVLQEERQHLLTLLSQQGDQTQRTVITQIQALEEREQIIQNTLQGLISEVHDLAAVSREFTDIERELTIATDNLSKFVAKREGLQIDLAQEEIPWEIVTPPSEPLAIPVSLPQNLLLGSALGLLLGIGAALLLDKTAGIIHSDEDIKRVTHLPVLGRIPANQMLAINDPARIMAESLQSVGQSIRAERNGNRVRSADEQRMDKILHKSYGGDPFSEAFRSLYTNLRLLNTDKSIRSIAISSVMAGEGKSTVAIYLAESAAAMGQRVLLVDTDLRNPQIHNYLELSNSKGLTNLFSGDSNPAVIQKFSIEPNMYVLTAGSAAFEPTRLLASRSMKSFTEQVKAKFDLVIYDTPPLLGQSDAYLVANYADGLLLITQPGKLKQPLLDRAMEELSIADIKILGLVTREG